MPERHECEVLRKVRYINTLNYLPTTVINCDKTYIGETGRKFGVRLQEHRTEVESNTGRTFTRSLRASSLTEHNKSALTDHATQENHVINRSQATLIDREP